MRQQEIYYDRQLMGPVIFGWLFLILVYFFSTNSLLSQLQQPVLINPGSDNTFWLLHILRIPQFLLGHYWAALTFDILLTVSCLVCVFVPNQRAFTILTVAGTWLLYICYCTAAGKHYAQVGYLLAPLPFLVSGQKKFPLAWEGLRYWVCFLYTAAGLYKIYYGGFAFEENMSRILYQMNAEWLFFHPEGFQSALIRKVAASSSVAQGLYQLTVVAELSICVGFFTRKLDKGLLAILVIFHLGNLLLLRIPFVEQSLIFAPFLPWKRWAQYFHSTTGNDRPLSI
jgi:hypothetical protein